MPADGTVRGPVEFRIPAVPPSLNRLLRNRGLRITEPSKWGLLVRSAARGIAPFRIPVRIELAFIGVRGDADNYAKLVMDGLVRSGLIVDDGYPYVAALTLRVKPLRGGQRCTIVKIAPAGIEAA